VYFVKAGTGERFLMAASSLGVVMANKNMEEIPLRSVIVGTIGSKEGERRYRKSWIDRR
jgi:hypothetical protein